MGIRDRLRKIFGRHKPTEVDALVTERDWESKVPGFPGSATQFNGTLPKWRNQQLVIGLDFGTAYSKAVIGETRRHYAVPLANGKGLDQYIAPSVFYMSKQGDCFLSDVGGGNRRISNLKMHLLERDFSHKSFINCAIYVALCLRRIRYWLLSSQEDVYKGLRLSWVLNLGLPTDSYEDHQLVSAYEKIAQTGWALSVYPGNITHGVAQQLVQCGFPLTSSTLDDLEIDPEQLLSVDEICLFPEFLAQIAGYVRSPGRQPDLHMLVDVGAGTMDATTFNVHIREDEDHFPVFSKSVTNHGVHFLIRHRLDSAKVTDSPNKFDPVPIVEEFAIRMGTSKEAVEEADIPFRRDTYNTIGARLVHTRSEMYVKSPRWKDGVPVFLTGGGSNIDFYQNVLKRFSDRDSIPISIRKIPMPRNLSAPGLENQHFNRLSVAYGLSFDPDDLGSTLFSELDPGTDDKEQKREWRDNYIDQSLV